MLLDFHSSRFRAASAPNVNNGWDTLMFNEVDLLHSTYTVGRANRFQVVRHGLYSLYEMIYRTAMIRANIYENSDGYLEKSPAYINLDPSEKGAVSYFIGMTVLKLLCESKLDLPYIMHLEVYEPIIRRRYGPINYRNGRSRPDFIGLNSNLDWFVFESKGRSNNLPDGVLDDAKDQSRMIRTIGGDTPLIKAASVSYFDRNVLKATWKDPEGEHEFVNLDLEDLNPIMFIKDYYKQYFELAKSSLRRNEKGYIIFELNMIGAEIKIPEQLFYKLQESNLTEQELSKILKETQTLSSEFKKNELTKQGKDGIILELDQSWKDRFKKKVEDEKD